jgi:hypothetical protein
MQMSLLAIIDYSLIVIFFIAMTGLLLLYTRSHQQTVASATLPSPHEEPATYVFLAVLFLLIIVMTILTRKMNSHRAEISA